MYLSSQQELYTKKLTMFRDFLATRCPALAVEFSKMADGIVADYKRCVGINRSRKYLAAWSGSISQEEKRLHMERVDRQGLKNRASP